MKFVDIIVFFVLFTIVNYCNTFVFPVSRKVIVFTTLFSQQHFQTFHNMFIIIIGHSLSFHYEFNE